jgi:zinc transporter 1/2/3
MTSSRLLLLSIDFTDPATTHDTSFALQRLKYRAEHPATLNPTRSKDRLHVAFSRREASQAGQPEAQFTITINNMSTCPTGNDYNGGIGIRASTIPVILVTSAFGAIFPVYCRKHATSNRIFQAIFFVSKYFGSGVIIATAFIHVRDNLAKIYVHTLTSRQLLAPAIEALTDPCLTGPITQYSWAEGIALLTIFLLFFVELMIVRYADFGSGDHDHGHTHSHDNSPSTSTPLTSDSPFNKEGSHGPNLKLITKGHDMEDAREGSHMPGEDHHGHAREHTHNDEVSANWQQQGHGITPEAFAAQMTAIFILEGGVVFHSIFVGLTLAVAGEEFKILYVVLSFHQFFEGLALGARLAEVPWPRAKRWTPYIMGLAYGLTTPIAIAVGMGVRKSYPPGSQTTLIVNGVFDSVSAGILIYTGLVELMAHEFMFSPKMMKAPMREVLSAFGLMCLGAGLMALLGKWA